MELQFSSPKVAMQDATVPSIVETNGRDQLRAKIVDRELKKPGYKAKIRAFCCHCIFDPYSEGTWLKQVEKCTSCDCPLYAVRPTPVKS